MITPPLKSYCGTADFKAVKKVQRLISVYNYFADKWGYEKMYLNLNTMTLEGVFIFKMHPSDSLTHLYKVSFQNDFMRFLSTKIERKIYSIFPVKY